MTISSSLFISRSPKHSPCSAVCGMMFKPSSGSQDMSSLVNKFRRVCYPIRSYPNSIIRATNQKPESTPTPNKEETDQKNQLTATPAKNPSMFAMRYFLKVIMFIEYAFGKDFLVTILTDGVSNPVNEISLFGFLNTAAPALFGNPKQVQLLIGAIPYFNVISKLILLMFVQTWVAKALAAAEANAVLDERKSESSQSFKEALVPAVVAMLTCIAAVSCAVNIRFKPFIPAGIQGVVVSEFTKVSLVKKSRFPRLSLPKKPYEEQDESEGANVDKEEADSRMG